MKCSFLGDRTFHFVNVKIKDALFRRMSCLEIQNQGLRNQMLGLKSWSYHLLSEYLTTMCLSFPQLYYGDGNNSTRGMAEEKMREVNMREVLRTEPGI